MTGSNAEVARRGFEAVMRGDLDAIAELLDPDVKWHGGDPSAPGSCHNREQALRFMRHIQMTGRLADVVEAGDKVVVVIDRADGERVANVTTFRDGHVVEMIHYARAQDALAAVGAG